MERETKRLAESIKAELRKNKIKDPNKRLRQQILSFAIESPEIPKARFFPVGLVPDHVQWHSEQDTPMWGNKPIYIWIVGIVSSFHFLKDRGYAMEDSVNINVKPFVTFVESAEDLLKRYGQPAVQSLTSNGSIAVERSIANGSDPSKPKEFLNVFDAREGYVDTIKSDPTKKITNENVAEGDVVLVEALLSRRPSLAVQPQPSASVVMFKLVDIILLADGEHKPEGQVESFGGKIRSFLRVSKA